MGNFPDLKRMFRRYAVSTDVKVSTIVSNKLKTDCVTWLHMISKFLFVNS